MSAKKIIFEQDAREQIKVGVKNLAKAVKITLGPRGRNVVIEKSYGAPLVTKDGVTVAKEIEFENAWENMGAQLVREVASKTSDLAGDGRAGAVWLITGRDPTGTSSVIGDLMVLANAVVYAIYLVVSRDLLSRWPPLVAVATFFVMAIPIVLPVTGLPSFGAADGTAWAALVFCVLGPTIGTYFLNLFALRAVPSSVVAIYIYLQPFVTSILAAALLGEGVTPRVLTAGLLSFAGVFLATRG